MTELWRSNVPNEEAEVARHSSAFEPWLAGDTRKKKRVAKARNSLQREAFEVSLS
jgi:hypothetical protein